MPDIQNTAISKKPKSGVVSASLAALVAPAGLRERKIQRQREQLVRIGIDLFCKKGYEATTVSEIVSLAHLSEQTFYRYFKTKDELAFEVNDENSRLALAALGRRSKRQKPLTSLKEAMLLIVDRIDKDKRTWEKMIRLIYSSPALEARVAFVGVQWSKLFAGALRQERSLSKSECFALDVEVALVMAAFNVATYHWAHFASSDSLRPWVAQAFAKI